MVRRARAGVFKRDPELPPHLHARYAAISKASWAEVFADLFWQTMGEDATWDDIMADAERRTSILAGYRKAATT